MDSYMRLKRNDDALMLDLIGNAINTVEFDIHLKSIKKLDNFQKLYINIAHLTEINNDTIAKFHKMNNYLNEKIIAFINVNPMQNCILNLFNLDKIFQIYMNQFDAIEAKNPVINRKFKVI